MGSRSNRGPERIVQWAAPHDDEQTWESAEDVAGAAVKVQAFEHSRGPLDADAM